MNRLLTSISLLAGCLTLVAVMAYEPTGKITIEMTDSLTFVPDTVRISAGDQITWKNTSMLVHSVTGDSDESTVEGSVLLPDGAEPFDSGLMDPGATFEREFSVAGVYRYFCIPHEGAKMRGTIIVEDAPRGDRGNREP